MQCVKGVVKALEITERELEQLGAFVGEGTLEESDSFSMGITGMWKMADRKLSEYTTSSSGQRMESDRVAIDALYLQRLLSDEKRRCTESRYRSISHPCFAAAMRALGCARDLVQHVTWFYESSDVSGLMNRNSNVGVHSNTSVHDTSRALLAMALDVSTVTVALGVPYVNPREFTLIELGGTRTSNAPLKDRPACARGGVFAPRVASLVACSHRAAVYCNLRHLGECSVDLDADGYDAYRIRRAFYLSYSCVQPVHIQLYADNADGMPPVTREQYAMKAPRAIMEWIHLLVKANPSVIRITKLFAATRLSSMISYGVTTDDAKSRSTLRVPSGVDDFRTWSTSSSIALAVMYPWFCKRWSQASLAALRSRLLQMARARQDSQLSRCDEFHSNS
jgi:hypothetical protein